MKTIEIDIGKCMWGCTAVVLRRAGDFISYNNNSYWIDLKDYNIWLRIAKYTKEGETLAKAIEAEITDERLINTCLAFCLPHLQADDFLDIIETTRKTAYREGQEKLQTQMRNLLGME
jgi:hypothetical protein